MSIAEVNILSPRTVFFTCLRTLETNCVRYDVTLKNQMQVFVQYASSVLKAVTHRRDHYRPNSLTERNFLVTVSSLLIYPEMC